MQIWLLSQPDPLELAGFEKALVAQLASRSMADPKLFGRMLTTQDTEGRFVSCLKTSTRGNSFIKLKVCLDRVRLWDAQGQPLHEPGDLTNRECKVRPELRQVWMMSGQCGLLIEVTQPDPPKKTINSINSINRLLAARTTLRVSENGLARVSRAFRLRRRWSKQAFVGIKTRRPATIDEN